jgi:hypothetical protein
MKYVMSAVLMGLNLIAGAALANGVSRPQVPQVDDGFPDRNGPFSAVMLFIPQAELTEFDKPATEGPLLTKLSQAKVGDIVAVKIMFAGAEANADGLLDVTYDLTVTQPDGKIYSEVENTDLPAIQGIPAAPDMIFDNRMAVVMVRFESKDQRGLYTARAVLHDNVSRRDIPLTAKVELLP